MGEMERDSARMKKAHCGGVPAVGFKKYFLCGFSTGIGMGVAVLGGLR